MERLQLRTYDGVALTGLLMLTPLFTTALSKITEQNGAAGWLSLMLSFVLMLCLFLICSVLTSRYEGMGIIEITSKVIGKPIAILYAISIAAYFCFDTGVQIRESIEILKIYGLSRTPVFVVAGLLLAAALVMNLFGGRAIVKTAGLFYIIVVLGIAAVILLGVNRYDPDQLVPVFGNGLPELAKNGAFASSRFDAVMILLLFAPAFVKPEKMRKAGLLTLVISAAAYIMLIVCFVMMFSPSVGMGLMSGVLEMGKTSYYNHFFYRFESFFLFFLIFACTLQASIGLFVARESIVSTFKLKTVRLVAVICAAIIGAVIFLPANIIELTKKYLPLIRQYSVFFMAGAPLLILIISSVKKVLKYEKA